MACRPSNLALTALLVALAAAVARPTSAAQFTELFAELTLEANTLQQKAGSPCPFTAAQGSTPDQAACGKAFTVHWSNETTNDDGLRDVELLQSGNALSAQFCAEGAGTTAGKGELWLRIGFGKDIAKNVRLKLDDATGGVLLTGYTTAPDGALTQACSAMYSISEDNGLAELMYDDLTGAAQA
ncbi:hypothetical protein ABPG75_006175 [Micractinium tetrahymenae]